MRETPYRPGNVYLVTFHVCYKLGISTAMQLRMRDLRALSRSYFQPKFDVGDPELVHIFSVGNMREYEKNLQRRWSSYLWNASWSKEFFVLPDDEVDWFCWQ